MKRIITLPAIALLALALVQPICALDINTGVGLGYTARFDSGEPALDGILGARLASWMDFVFPIGGNMYTGPEFGIHFMTWDLPNGAMVILSDFPLLYKIGIRSGFTSLEAIAGAMLSLDMVSELFVGMHALAGLRAGLGPLWLEGAIAMNIPPLEGGERSIYPRIFLGYKRSLLQSTPQF